MTSPDEVEQLISQDEFYGKIIIPLCFPVYFLNGEEGLRKQYMSPGNEDMTGNDFSDMLALCKRVMEVYAIILERKS